MIKDWLYARRSRQLQSDAEIQAFVDGVVSGDVTRAQAAAWLAFVFLNGMERSEAVALTRAMTASGETLSWPGIQGPFWDKHSTGGVGDKVSLVLAPLWAALGKRVPMLSGRALGLTGGTLDKLESIPGYRTNLTPTELHEVLAEVGCFINGQTESIAPADRILYALRDETCTVESIPLITASILSKKLVEGIERLVLDVKWGSGAFMKSKDEAQALADSLVEVGCGAGVETEAHLTDMNQPLGEAVGNALEVEEAVACLSGQGPADLRELVVLLSGDGDRARAALDDGSALQKWQLMVRAQGGDPEAPLHGAGCQRYEFCAPHAGTVTQCDAGIIGHAAQKLGAGRANAGQAVDFGVGFRVRARVGQTVAAGDSLVTVFFRAEKGLEAACDALQQAISLE